jgi:hypothetical protein
LGAARRQGKQAGPQTHQQKAQGVIDGWVAVSEAFGQECEQKAGREAENTGGPDAAGLGIELAAAQNHGMIPQKNLVFEAIPEYERDFCCAHRIDHGN